MLRVGEEAPDFELPDQDGRPVKLSDLREQPVVLYSGPSGASSAKTNDEKALAALASLRDAA